MQTIDIPAEVTTDQIDTQTNGTLAMSAVRFRIPGDLIHRATAELPDDQRETLRWLAGYCRVKNLGRDDIGTLIRKPGTTDCYSYDQFYQVVTGRRTAAGVNIDPFCEAASAFRRIIEDRESQTTSGFIQTRLYDIISTRARRCLLRRKIGWIFGDSQIGKSACAREYQRQHNHGETIYVEVPTGGGLGPFLSELAISLGIPTQQKNTELRRRIIDSFDDRMLLIIDEAHRCLQCKSGTRGLDTLDFLRELWNRKQCGMLIMMTNDGRDQLLRGKHKKSLEQLWRRRLQPLQLPSVPFGDDMDRFAAAYGLPPAPADTVTIRIPTLDADGNDKTITHRDSPARLQNSVVTEEGLGVWLTILQDASDTAREQSRSITWGAVIKSHALAQADAETAY
jgi:hypothetical protein